MDYVQIWIGSDEALEAFDEHMATVRARVGIDDGYELVRPEPIPGLTPHDQSNLLRVELATHSPNLCYVDVDCKLFSVPEMHPSAPYAGKHSYHVSGYLFFVNGHTATFERIRQRQVRLLEQNAKADIYGRFGVWQLAQTEVFRRVPKECYRHEYTTLRQRRKSVRLLTDTQNG